MKKIFNYLVILNLLGVILAGCENVTGPESDTRMENMKLIHLQKTVPKVRAQGFKVYNLALKQIQMISIPIDPPYKNNYPNEGVVILKYDPQSAIISYILNAHNLISEGSYTLQIKGINTDKIKIDNIILNTATAGSGGNLKITGIIELKPLPIYLYEHFELQIIDKNEKTKLRTDEISLISL